MVKKLKKQYETPNEGWSEERINREDELMEEYGLKNKREVYKAQSQLRALRREARKLVAAENEQERRELIEKANRLGLAKEDAELGDILSLNVTDILNRRLQTAVNRRGYSDTPREARQMVVHGHVYVDGERVTIPSYLVPQEEEKKIEIRMPEPDDSEEQETEEADEAGETEEDSEEDTEDAGEDEEQETEEPEEETGEETEEKEGEDE
ncbi:MAG: 30S ribosomal protein S4 [Candidatus Nanohaloarchaea archaeon]